MSLAWAEQGGDGEGADWSCGGVDQQARLDVHLAALNLSTLTNGGTRMDNGAALYLSKVRG